MTQDNVEVVRDLYETYNRGDFELATEMLHPEVELHQPPELCRRRYVLWPRRISARHGTLDARVGDVSL